MDLKKIKDLMTAMNKHRIDRICIRNEEMEIELEKHPAAVSSGAAPIAYENNGFVHEDKLDVALTKNTQAKMPSQAKGVGREPAQEGSSGKIVKSPMVGTYYSSASPGASPFVSLGQTVQKDTVVCIIEAMKVMNEIKAGVEGKVVEIFPDNASPVEFGSSLVRIE